MLNSNSTISPQLEQARPRAVKIVEILEPIIEWVKPFFPSLVKEIAHRIWIVLRRKKKAPAEIPIYEIHNFKLVPIPGNPNLGIELLTKDPSSNDDSTSSIKIVFPNRHLANILLNSMAQRM